MARQSESAKAPWHRELCPIYLSDFMISGICWLLLWISSKSTTHNISTVPLLLKITGLSQISNVLDRCVVIYHDKVLMQHIRVLYDRGQNPGFVCFGFRAWTITSSISIVCMVEGRGTAVRVAVITLIITPRPTSQTKTAVAVSKCWQPPTGVWQLRPISTTQKIGKY